jgi:hypothetical protein
MLPRMKEIATSINVAAIVVLAPYKTLENTHLPRLSVPNRNSPDGADLMADALVAYGSLGAITLAKRAISTKSSATPADIITFILLIFFRLWFIKKTSDPKACR